MQLSLGNVLIDGSSTPVPPDAFSANDPNPPNKAIAPTSAFYVSQWKAAMQDVAVLTGETIMDAAGAGYQSWFDRGQSGSAWDPRIAIVAGIKMNNFVGSGNDNKPWTIDDLTPAQRGTLRNYAFATQGPQFFNIEAEPLMYKATGDNWWTGTGISSRFMTTAELDQFERGLQKFRDDPVFAKGTRWYWWPLSTGLFDSNTQAILDNCIDIASRIGRALSGGNGDHTVQMYATPMVGPQYSQSDDYLFGFKSIESAADVGKAKLVPALWVYGYNLVPDDRYYRPQQLLEALNLALAIYPNVSRIVLDCPGREFVSACRAAAQLVTRFRALYGIAA